MRQDEPIQRLYHDLEIRVVAQIDDRGPLLCWEAFPYSDPEVRHWSGCVSWDGCLKLQDLAACCGFHFEVSGMEELRRVTALAERLYKLAAEVLPGWHA